MLFIELYMVCANLPFFPRKLILVFHANRVEHQKPGWTDDDQIVIVVSLGKPPGWLGFFLASLKKIVLKKKNPPSKFCFGCQI